MLSRMQRVNSELMEVTCQIDQNKGDLILIINF